MDFFWDAWIGFGCFWTVVEIRRAWRDWRGWRARVNARKREVETRDERRHLIGGCEL